MESHQAELELQYEEQLEKKDDSEVKAALEAAKAYNSLITPGTENGGAFSKEAQEAAAKGYADVLNINGDGVMGYVEIPKIDVSLPIYHGTDDTTLDRGAGHLVGSSLPIGGVGTHSIVTAHSGMAKQRMFTDLEHLSEGDVFYLKVLGETLAYKVDQIKVVEPHEVANLYIDKDKDQSTLITCTPYAVNTHRLLVRGQRIPYEEAEVIVEETPVVEATSSSWGQGYMRGVIIGLCMALILILIIAVFMGIRKKIRKARKKKETT